MVAEMILRGVKVTLMAMMEVNHDSCEGNFQPNSRVARSET